MNPIQLVEVGPRDGLQNEAKTLSIQDKLRFIALLAGAGFRRIEAASFVHPKWVPQMADAKEVYARLPAGDGVRYSALVPNLKGLEDALEAGAREVVVFTATSETFNHKNINMGVEASFEVIEAVIARAHQEGVVVRGSLSTCFGCPYEGEVGEAEVVRLTQRLLELGCYEVAVSDTIGVATPGDVDRVLGALLPKVGEESIALHLHDTRGTALANLVRALGHGVRTFDCAAGGAGGCPFAPGAAGNVASEDVLYALHGLGYETGVSLDKVKTASRFLESMLGKTLTSRVLHSPPWPQVLEAS